MAFVEPFAAVAVAHGSGTQALASVTVLSICVHFRGPFEISLLERPSRRARGSNRYLQKASPPPGAVTIFAVRPHLHCDKPLVQYSLPSEYCCETFFSFLAISRTHGCCLSPLVRLPLDDSFRRRSALFALKGWCMVFPRVSHTLVYAVW